MEGAKGVWHHGRGSLLGGYEFQGSILGIDGSCKDGKMGQGAANSGRKRRSNEHELAEKRKA